MLLGIAGLLRTIKDGALCLSKLSTTYDRYPPEFPQDFRLVLRKVILARGLRWKQHGYQYIVPIRSIHSHDHQTCCPEGPGGSTNHPVSKTESPYGSSPGCLLRTRVAAPGALVVDEGTTYQLLFPCGLRLQHKKFRLCEGEPDFR